MSGIGRKHSAVNADRGRRGRRPGNRREGDSRQISSDLAAGVKSHVTGGSGARAAGVVSPGGMCRYYLRVFQVSVVPPPPLSTPSPHGAGDLR